MKQRILGLALSLALLATFGLSLTANAATSGIDKINVTASTTDVLTIEVGPSTIDFGTMDFLGNSTGADVKDHCDVTNGARFIGPDVAVTVSSSRSYKVDRGVYDNGGTTAPQAQLLDRAYVSPGKYQGSCSTPLAQSVNYIMAHGTYFEDSGSAGKNIVANEFYIIEVLAGDTTGSYDVRVEYSASQF